MSIKLKKICISLFISIIVFSTFIIFSINSVHAATTNPNTDINCSKYLNILHNDYFMEKITVSNLKTNPNYLIGVNYIEKYDSIIAPDKMKKNNIGFKCNGIFYSDYLEIDKTGKYVFEVYNYKVEDGIKKCYGAKLETITIDVNIENTLTLKKENFYFEHYGTDTALLEKIEKSFNLNVKLTNYSSGKIKEAYSNYLNYKNSNENNDISSNVDKEDVLIEVNYNSKTFRFYINLLSTSNVELKSSFVTDYELLTKNVPDIAFDVKSNPEIVGEYIESKLANYLDISKYLNYSEAQNIEVTIVQKGVIIPSLNSSDEKFKQRQITYIIKDYVTKTEINYGRWITFYNSNFVTGNNRELTVKYNEDFHCGKNQKFNLNEYIDEVYYNVILNEKNYKDYHSIKNVELFGEVDTSILGEKRVGIKITDSSGDIHSKENTFMINDFLPPIILTQYDYIIMDKDELKYLNQIKIIDNNQVDIAKTTYKIEKTSETGGYIVITAYDIEGISSTLTVPFVYETTPTLYQKTIGKLMYNWGKILKSIF